MMQLNTGYLVTLVFVACRYTDIWYADIWVSRPDFWEKKI